MNRWQFAGAAFAAIGLAQPADALTQGTLRAAGRTGQASLFRAKDQCLAVTAGHVIGDAVQGTVMIGQVKSYRATVLYKSETVDLALLSVDMAPNDPNCTDPLESSAGAQVLLNGGSEVLVQLAGGGLIGGAIASRDHPGRAWKCARARCRILVSRRGSAVRSLPGTGRRSGS